MANLLNNAIELVNVWYSNDTTDYNVGDVQEFISNCHTKALLFTDSPNVLTSVILHRTLLDEKMQHDRFLMDFGPTSYTVASVFSNGYDAKGILLGLSQRPNEIRLPVLIVLSTAFKSGVINYTEEINNSVIDLLDMPSLSQQVVYLLNDIRSKKTLTN
jgi:hypothetical protein